MSQELTLPTWDLTSVYPDLASDEFNRDIQKIIELTDNLEQFLSENKIDPSLSPNNLGNEELTQIITDYIQRLNDIRLVADTIDLYLDAILSTDSYNEQAKRAFSEFEPVKVRLDHLSNVIFKGWLGGIGDRLDGIIETNETLKDHSFMLRETFEQSKYLMSPAEEELAGQLSMSGISAWAKLQNDVATQLKWVFEDENGEVKLVPAITLISYRGHENEAIRRRAYEAEMAAWKTVETPLAAALNGVKGYQAVISQRRGRKNFIHESLDRARIDQQTLDAMLTAVKSFFPVIRKYFKAKAKHLGTEALPWWNVYAPIGKTERKFTFPEAQKFILETFAGFSEDLSEFASRAFKNNWIDAAPRDGKSSGAFCTELPAVKESRIMLNYSENLTAVSTLAHELGHGYHYHLLFKHPRLLQIPPLTLEETASIMCESMVTDATINLASNDQEKLAILGAALINDGWMIADIYSRYLFETEVFERRTKAELSAEEINEIMEWAQLQTYGDGLDPDYLNKYMWAWKPHYYWPVQAFYNYQYTFGKFFSIGLYAIYLERGADFVEDYKNLLASAGLGTAADLAARFDIDLRSPAFWEGSLKVVERRVKEFIAL